MAMLRFDAAALYKALDKQRSDRGLTWSQVAAEIGVSAATIKRTQNGGRMEVDGMLAMVSWLRMSVDAFVRDAGR
jgi:transcriptional regulator with XRE-family HTH domain